MTPCRRYHHHHFLNSQMFFSSHPNVMWEYSKCRPTHCQPSDTAGLNISWQEEEQTDLRRDFVLQDNLYRNTWWRNIQGNLQDCCSIFHMQFSIIIVLVHKPAQSAIDIYGEIATTGAPNNLPVLRRFACDSGDCVLTYLTLHTPLY